MLNPIIDQAILYKIPVEITFQVSKKKVSTLSTELMEVVKMNEKWWVLTQAGLAIELGKVKSVVLK